MATRQCNWANYSFLIETFTDRGERLMMWRIDQYIDRPNAESDTTRLTNVVENHLHGLSERTGLHYSCFAQGPKDEIDRTVQRLRLEIS